MGQITFGHIRLLDGHEPNDPPLFDANTVGLEDGTRFEVLG